MRQSLFLSVLIGLFWGTHADAEPFEVKGDPAIIPAGAKLQTLWEEGGFTEGVAAADDGTMYFSDFAQPFDARPARVMKFDPITSKTSIHCADSKMANGLMFNRQGRLFACCASPLGGARALVEIVPDGKVKVVVDKFEGKRFNSPNDIVIDPRGRIYFSDPKYVGPEQRELDHMSVYRYDPDGSLHRMTDNIDKPNGIIMAPNGRRIYVAETDNGTDQADSVTAAKRGRMTLNAFRVKNDGSLARKKVLVDFGDQLGIDGMTVDQQGHIFAAVRSEERFGIRIYDSRGKELGYIQTPELPTNCSFGKGKGMQTLYITAGGGLYRIVLEVSGFHPATARPRANRKKS